MTLALSTPKPAFGERIASAAASLMMKGIAAGYAARTGIKLDETQGAPVLLQVNFEVAGDLDTFETKMEGFAPFLSNTLGMTWKIWSLDRETRRANGTYVFETAAHAEMYMAEILPQGMGNDPTIHNVEHRILPVLQKPSRLTHAKF